MLNNNIVLISCVLISAASSFDSIAKSKEQAELDNACEKARQTALMPQKKKIYNECLTTFKKSKDICIEEAKIYNGNRINGAPLFYELPACVKAFEFNKQQKK